MHRDPLLIAAVQAAVLLGCAAVQARSAAGAGLFGPAVAAALATFGALLVRRALRRPSLGLGALAGPAAAVHAVLYAGAWLAWGAPDGAAPAVLVTGGAALGLVGGFFGLLGVTCACSAAAGASPADTGPGGSAVG